MKKQELYDIKCTWQKHPVFAVAAKDFGKAAVKAAKIITADDPQAEVISISRNNLLILEEGQDEE